MNIWAKAASQILFSLSVAFGSQLVLSSYNTFRNNTHRDSLIIGLCNSLTSLYAGIVVFLILGFLAKKTGGEIQDVVKGGISLAFVSYPSAVLEMEVAPLWSFLFFFMLINLALSSICGGVQTFLAFILDEKPEWTKYRTYIVMGLCLMFFLAGLPMCTNGGILLFTVFDKRCTSSLLFICILEVIHVAWFYGFRKFFDNLSEMTVNLPKPIQMYWSIMWVLITPGILAFITVLAWADHEPMSYDDYQFPASVEALGWIMELLPLAIVLLYPIIPFTKAWREGFRGRELMDELLKPSEEWYTAQMERRNEELKSKEEAKYVHHNLGYDHDENMQGSNDLKPVSAPPAYSEIDGIKKAELNEIESLKEAKFVDLPPAETINFKKQSFAETIEGKDEEVQYEVESLKEANVEIINYDKRSLSKAESVDGKAEDENDENCDAKTDITDADQNEEDQPASGPPEIKVDTHEDEDENDENQDAKTDITDADQNEEDQAASGPPEIKVDTHEDEDDKKSTESNPNPIEATVIVDNSKN